MQPSIGRAEVFALAALATLGMSGTAAEQNMVHPTLAQTPAKRSANSTTSASVSIIGRRVYIDGVAIPDQVTRYTSKESGDTYRIERTATGVSVVAETTIRKSASRVNIEARATGSGTVNAGRTVIVTGDD